jgi:hypothetical protein
MFCDEKTQRTIPDKQHIDFLQFFDGDFVGISIL